MLRRINPNQPKPEPDPLYELSLEKTKDFKGKQGKVVVDGKEYSYGAMQYFEGPQVMYLITMECEGITKCARERSTMKGYAVCFKAFIKEFQQKELHS